MGSILPAVIDYLVGGLPAPLTAIDSTVVVADNEPGLRSQSLVVIGRSGPSSGTAAATQDDYLILGAGSLEEAWTLDGYIQTYRPGPGQKAARDACFDLWDGLIHFLHTDLTFGGLLKRGRYAHVGRGQYSQTQDDDDTGESGALRMAMIGFEINVPNTYTP